MFWAEFTVMLKQKSTLNNLIFIIHMWSWMVSKIYSVLKFGGCFKLESARFYSVVIFLHYHNEVRRPTDSGASASSLPIDTYAAAL